MFFIPNLFSVTNKIFLYTNWGTPCWLGSIARRLCLRAEGYIPHENESPIIIFIFLLPLVQTKPMLTYLTLVKNKHFYPLENQTSVYYSIGPSNTHINPSISFNKHEYQQNRYEIIKKLIYREINPTTSTSRYLYFDRGRAEKNKINKKLLANSPI